MSQAVTPDEREQLNDFILTLSDEHLSEMLESLASRELELLKTGLGEGEMREITLANVAALCAAVERLKPGSPKVIRDQTRQPNDGTSQGSP